MKYAIFERTPPESVEFIKEYIKNKIVYELGAGDGEFALALSKYAKRVVCVEVDPYYAEQCKIRGLETINDSFLKVLLKEAEVIYFFTSFIGTYVLTKKIEKENWHGTLISHYYPLQSSPLVIKPPNKIIDVDLEYISFPFLIYEL